jgi:hypothetical protein
LESFVNLCAFLVSWYLSGKKPQRLDETKSLQRKIDRIYPEILIPNETRDLSLESSRQGRKENSPRI